MFNNLAGTLRKGSQEENNKIRKKMIYRDNMDKSKRYTVCGKRHKKDHVCTLYS